MCSRPEPWRSALSGRRAHRSGGSVCLLSSFPELQELRIWAAVRWPGVSRRHPVHQALEGQASPGASPEQQLPEASRALGPPLAEGAEPEGPSRPPKSSLTPIVASITHLSDCRTTEKAASPNTPEKYPKPMFMRRSLREKENGDKNKLVKAVYSQEGPQDPGARGLPGVKGTLLLRLLFFFFIGV